MRRASWRQAFMVSSTTWRLALHRYLPVVLSVTEASKGVRLQQSDLDNIHGTALMDGGTLADIREYPSRPRAVTGRDLRYSSVLTVENGIDIYCAHMGGIS
jgi:hypothetical protein